MQVRLYLNVVSRAAAPCAAAAAEGRALCWRVECRRGAVGVRAAGIAGTLRVLRAHCAAAECRRRIDFCARREHARIARSAGVQNLSCALANVRPALPARYRAPLPRRVHVVRAGFVSRTCLTKRLSGLISSVCCRKKTSNSFCTYRLTSR